MKVLQPSGGDAALATVGESSHDTLIWDKHKNFLVNAAGLGVYVHGMIHQSSELGIYVSDLIHSRGPLATDDILLMEKQVLKSTPGPLSTNSRLGRLVAMAVMPSMSTTNGEGNLIGYYENGVVSYNTFLFPREDRFTADGKIIQKGWSEKQMVAHSLNTISATGRYSVTVLPRDHFFRSRFGLHFLKISAGEGNFTDEAINTISQDVLPLLKADDRTLLWGAATGQWLEGHRLFASVGMTYSQTHSSSPISRGFVSYNQAATYTEDRTPRPLWEGLWTFDEGVAGLHKFEKLPFSHTNDYGFICSSDDEHLYFAEIDSKLKTDTRDGVEIPIEWEVILGKWMAATTKTSTITDCRMEGIFSKPSHKVRVSIRTDKEPQWKSWSEVSPCDKDVLEGQEILRNFQLGQPPKDYREATWFQFKIEGLGHAEITAFALDYSEGVSKNAKSYCVAQTPENPDYFRFNNESASTRWPAQ